MNTENSLEREELRRDGALIRIMQIVLLVALFCVGVMAFLCANHDSLCAYMTPWKEQALIILTVISVAFLIATFCMNRRSAEEQTMKDENMDARRRSEYIEQLRWDERVLNGGLNLLSDLMICFGVGSFVILTWFPTIAPWPVLFWSVLYLSVLFPALLFNGHYQHAKMVQEIRQFQPQRFCLACGTALAPNYVEGFCPQCDPRRRFAIFSDNVKTQPSQRFCRYCGTRLIITSRDPAVLNNPDTTLPFTPHLYCRQCKRLIDKET